MYTKTIANMQELASPQGGRCLSESYQGSHTKLKWQCRDGHIWEAWPTNVQQGKWCPRCRGMCQTIADMQQIAQKRGGECLSSEYIAAKTDLEWKCQNGHMWKAAPDTIKSKGSWCPYCAGRHKTIEDMQIWAADRGGACLSRNYISAHAKLEWECGEGHVFEMNPNAVQQGGWCHVCSHRGSGLRSRKYTVQDLQEWAAKKRGKCLDLSYEGIKEKVEWECEKGHRWEAAFDNVANGDTWCPHCAHKFPRTIEEMQELAVSRGGECLSDNMDSVEARLEWKCKGEHIWETRAADVIGGSWCPYCAGRHKTIEDMRDAAKKHGGQCLSSEYVSWNLHLDWQCSKGHIWRATPNNVLMGYWCRICGHDRAGLKRRLTIEDVQKIARQKGGKCLTTEYESSRDHFKWGCQKGHTWEATFDNVKRGTWCPKCWEGHHEKLCREIFEQIFQKPFVRTRSVLENRLELDGYCNELRLAFEYNGQQHYKRHSLWHRTPDALEKQQERDAKKAHLCEEKGIELITIPYTENHRLEEFIRENLP